MRLSRHDSLGHAVNLMVMQAGVGRHVFDEQPELRRPGARAGRERGAGRARRARRGAEGAAPDGRKSSERLLIPRNLAGIDALCDRIRSTGREVDLRVEPVAPTPTAGAVADPIVQEALTNVARHSKSGPIEASITRDNGDAVITVHNTGKAFAVKGSGRGLVNMRERAHLEGGELESGPVADGFLVREPAPPRGRPMITVLLADDDVLVRQGLRGAVESAGDLSVVAEAADGAQAIELAESTRPDVVVMDVRMPGRDGSTNNTRRSHRGTSRDRELVLTTFDLDEIVHDCSRPAPTASSSSGRRPTSSSQASARSPPATPSSRRRSPDGCWATSLPRSRVPRASSSSRSPTEKPRCCAT